MGQVIKASIPMTLVLLFWIGFNYLYTSYISMASKFDVWLLKSLENIKN